MCRGEEIRKGVPVLVTMTERTNTFRSTNNAHGRLTDVNLFSITYTLVQYRIGFVLYKCNF